jgi:hypothetical protein
VPKVTIIDFDTVEEHNAPHQNHPRENTGSKKVDSLVMEIDRHMKDACEVVPIDGKGEDHDFMGPVITGLDSMKARKAVWERLKDNPLVPVLFDARIAGQLVLVYTICPYDPNDIEQYEATLHSDEEAVRAPCTERGVIDVGMLVGSVLTRGLRMHYAEKPQHKITYINQATLAVTKGGWIGEN